MAFFTQCGACAVGNHAEHDGTHHGQPGVLGGWCCICPGDCKVPDLSSLFPPEGSRS